MDSYQYSTNARLERLEQKIDTLTKVVENILEQFDAFSPPPTISSNLLLKAERDEALKKLEAVQLSSNRESNVHVKEIKNLLDKIAILELNLACADSTNEAKDKMLQAIGIFLKVNYQ